MQLNDKNIKRVLTAATCALLGTNVHAQDDTPWSFDTALMYYGETDRVTAIEGIISATKEFEDEHFLNLKLTYDTLTGASATGAVPQNEIQTFTRPSGNGSYDIKAGETPLDDTFKDTRAQFNAQWTQPLNENYLASAGVHVSNEYDYFSFGVNGNIARYFNQKNTTVSLGLSYSNDTIKPNGGLPVPFAPMLPAGTEPNRLGDSDDKVTTDILIGLTQVINRRMIMQFNYSYSKADGYLTDPFKVVSVVDNNGMVLENLYENRPDTRVKQSVYWQAKYHFTDSVIDFSHRYMWDDWNIKSNTFDVKYRMMFQDSYIEPHVRYYMQDAAKFYRPFALQGETAKYQSADYRIGEMTGLTLGIKYGIPLDNDQELSFRLEFFQQTPTNTGFEQPGILADLDLNPSVEAVVLQMNYSF